MKQTICTQVVDWSPVETDTGKKDFYNTVTFEQNRMYLDKSIDLVWFVIVK